MAAKKNPSGPDPDEGAVPEPVEGEPVEGEPVEGREPADDDEVIEAEPVIEAEGPDIETSFTEADLSFLSGQGSADQLAAERLSDLQRVTAEYANYRKRTEENREVERERAVGETMASLLPVLDDLDLAEKHGDLAEGGAFATIGAKLRANVERLGLKPFGVAGELFDHNVHEAIFQQPNPDVEVETVADVVQTGYFLGSTMLRAAKVVVSVPEGLDG